MKEHLNVFKQVELLPGSFISVMHTLPSVLLRKESMYNIVTNGELEVGDLVQDWPRGNVVVDEVIEQRKARGDWSGKLYSGMKPVFNQVRVSIEERK